MDAKYAKTQELLFELKVADVMRAEVITMSPEQSMAELRHTLRAHRISGAPVVVDGDLVGMITIADLISHLTSDGPAATVGDKMTRDPEALFADQLLVHAIKQFDRSRFGRYPVLHPQSRKLVGILTKGLIIEGMLRAMEKALQEEEVRQYRASHIFEDLTAEYKEIYLTYEVVGKDFELAGKASTQMKRNLKRLGIRPDIVHRLAIASYEAEMNTVIYTDGGIMEFRIAPEEIVMRVRDHGPGIQDIEKVLQPGYSTAPDWVREMGFGAGMGIPNIKKNADKLEITSSLGVGTTLSVRIFTGKETE